MCLLLSFVGFVMVYVMLHNYFEKAYKRDILPDVRAAVRMYGIREADTGALELTVEGQTYNAASKDPGPLGVNNIAAVRGLLSSTAGAVDAYNEQLAGYVARVLRSFRESRRNPAYSWAPLSAVAPGLAAKLECEHEEGGAELVCKQKEKEGAEEGAQAEGKAEGEAEAEGDSVALEQEEGATAADSSKSRDDAGMFRIEVSSSVLSRLRELRNSEGRAQGLIVALKGGHAYRTSDAYPLPARVDANEDAYSRLARTAILAANEICQNMDELGERLRAILGVDHRNDASSKQANPTET